MQTCLDTSHDSQEEVHTEAWLAYKVCWAEATVTHPISLVDGGCPRTTVRACHSLKVSLGVG